MLLHLALFVLAAAANLALAAVVYFHNPTRRPNRLFSAFAVAVAIWTVGIAMALSSANRPSSLFYARLTFAAACLSIYSLVMFLHSFPSTPLVPSPLPLRPVGVAAAFLIATAFTPWLVSTVSATPDGLRLSYGPIYLPFAIFVFLCIVASFMIVLRKLRLTRGVQQLQIRYLFFGLIVPCVLATVTNLIIPLLFRTSTASRYGPLFSLIMVLLVAHTIIRHRLMDVSLFVRRSVTYLIALTLTVGFFLVLIATIHSLIRQTPTRPTWIELTTVLLVALLFQRIKMSVQLATDKYLYRRTYDYHHTIREASSRMATLLDLSSLLEYLSHVVTITTASEFVTVYLSDNRGLFEPIFRPPSAHSNTSTSPCPASPIVRDSPIPIALATNRTALSRDELLLSDPHSTIVRALQSLNATLVLPMFADNDLIAILLLGPKRSGDPYFAEDIDLLSILASQASVAIRNAQLYRQVLRVNGDIEKILATIENGVIAVDPDGNITLFNRAAAVMAGVQDAASRPRHLSGLPKPLRLPLEATLLDHQPRLSVESDLRRPHGKVVPIVSSATAFTGADSTSLGAVIVFSDLTQLRTLEIEKRRAERLASFGALASGLAHEIKNPLVAIRTFAELLPERFADAEFRDTFSAVAIREIERIDQLVARLRGLALSSSQILEPMNLIDPMEETLLLLRGQLEQKHIHVQRILGDQRPLISGDFDQLKQLFLNLFLNAIDAMHDNGILTIRLSLSTADYAPEAILQITDTGPGISPHILAKLFDPFVTTKLEGSGLGLAICRGIADAHNATIRVDNNTSSTGTTVSLTFPLIQVSVSLVTS